VCTLNYAANSILPVNSGDRERNRLLKTQHLATRNCRIFQLQTHLLLLLEECLQECNQSPRWARKMNSCLMRLRKVIVELIWIGLQPDGSDQAGWSREARSLIYGGPAMPTVKKIFVLYLSILRYLLTSDTTDDVTIDVKLCVCRPVLGTTNMVE